MPSPTKGRPGAEQDHAPPARPLICASDGVPWTWSAGHVTHTGHEAALDGTHCTKESFFLEGSGYVFHPFPFMYCEGSKAFPCPLFPASKVHLSRRSSLQALRQGAVRRDDVKAQHSSLNAAAASLRAAAPGVPARSSLSVVQPARAAQADRYKMLPGWRECATPSTWRYGVRQHTSRDVRSHHAALGHSYA